VSQLVKDLAVTGGARCAANASQLLQFPGQPLQLADAVLHMPYVLVEHLVHAAAVPLRLVAEHQERADLLQRQV
jgi:hypothetical protein